MRNPRMWLFPGWRCDFCIFHCLQNPELIVWLQDLYHFRDSQGAKRGKAPSNLGGFWEHSGNILGGFWDREEQRYPDIVLAQHAHAVQGASMPMCNVQCQPQPQPLQACITHSHCRLALPTTITCWHYLYPLALALLTPLPLAQPRNDVGGFKGYRRCRRPHGCCCVLLFVVCCCCYFL